MFPSYSFFKPSCGISTATIVQGRNKKKFDECWFSGFFELYFCCCIFWFFVVSSNPLMKFDGCCYLFLLLYFLDILDCGWEDGEDVKKIISEFVFGGFCVFGKWWILMVKSWICWVDDEHDDVWEWITCPLFFPFLLIFFISINTECNF